MKNKALQADGILLLVAVIWGFAFVAQIKGMDHMAPFFFNGIRFLLGGLSLLPVYYFLNKRRPDNPAHEKHLSKIWGPVLGIILFFASSMQQIGLQYTTAGNSGFITGLYIIIVPVMGILLGQSTRPNTWAGGLIALIGLYFLTVSKEMTLNPGDMITIGTSVLYAIQIIILSRVARRINPIELSVIQFFVCGISSLLVAYVLEPMSFNAISNSIVSLLYAGILSTGVGFTIQVIGQRDAIASHAAIILGLEAVFAVLGGWLILNEQLGIKGLVGCGLMLLGMIISRLQFGRFKKTTSASSIM